MDGLDEDRWSGRREYCLHCIADPRFWRDLVRPAGASRECLVDTLAKTAPASTRGQRERPSAHCVLESLIYETHEPALCQEEMPPAFGASLHHTAFPWGIPVG